MMTSNVLLNRLAAERDLARFFLVQARQFEAACDAVEAAEAHASCDYHTRQAEHLASLIAWLAAEPAAA